MGSLATGYGRPVMIDLCLPQPGPLKLLCLGAHGDDIEIGAGGTIRRLLGERPGSEVFWTVLSGGGTPREAEARASAAAFVAGAATSAVEVLGFRDGFFPHSGASLKEYFESLKSRVAPDLVLTHTDRDAHQDHRLVCELTYNTFRDHLILEYEIPKWEPDLGTPNLFVALDEAVIQMKIELLMTHFGTQRAKDWFDRDLFLGLARIRGMQCRSPSRFAEAFHVRKVRLSSAPGGAGPAGVTGS